jgi:hypothetical protein
MKIKKNKKNLKNMSIFKLMPYFCLISGKEDGSYMGISYVCALAVAFVRCEHRQFYSMWPNPGCSADNGSKRKGPATGHA